MLKLGKVFVTRGVHTIIESDPMLRVTMEICLELYQRYNWGDTCKKDKKLNDIAVKEGYRVLASYHLDKNIKIWIITEYDRSYTTILLPEEY